MNNRIKQIRKSFNLSQKEFGERLGITDTAISKIEKGFNSPSDQTIKLICKEFNIDYYWLTEGTGEMFTHFPETIIDELIDEYGLDDYDRYIVECYLDASREQRQAVKDFLLTLAEKAAKKKASE